MRREVNNMISVVHSALRIAVYKIVRGNSFKGHIIQRFSPNVVLEWNKGSSVTLGKMVRIHSGSKVKVRRGAELTIGNNVKINYYCIIACHNKVSIGEGAVVSGCYPDNSVIVQKKQQSVYPY